ncbi:MAG: hypothetical protein J0L92_17595 [Deltaproteobacteria bacterium]|nr:hypothetical protein [Deltaproteobacteria bacterium]
MTTNEQNETVTIENETVATENETVATEATASGPTRDPHVEQTVERTVEVAGHIVEAAVDIGRTWAAYGLRVGKLALETHARTMGKVAGALGEIDRAIDARRDERDASSTH